ncbi:uncharacterized protein LOC103886387 isoform X2 [Papio anubis]|uniref:uncharacterized protein LOC103886387 isoform X2 n=1 Tax=Papio anubis TaxID=9555 RepID=UPI0012AE5D72|nr:uncharacterized protein LOC103886387 isoform X2 [Papio anubis]XP_021797626.2 uncharacterized protein LOC103886387 isoform X2 [Papio anubis]XP_021797627.2 uncharacterized protein LOC103886387 isoform X2 [Papio anubis]
MLQRITTGAPKMKVKRTTQSVSQGYASVRTPSGPLRIPALCIKPYHGMARTQPGTRNEGTDLTGPTAPDDVASMEDTSPGHHLGMQSWNKSNDHLARQTCCCTHLYSSVNRTRCKEQKRERCGISDRLVVYLEFIPSSGLLVLLTSRMKPQTLAECYSS